MTISDVQIMRAYDQAIAQGGSADSVIVRTVRGILATRGAAPDHINAAAPVMLKTLQDMDGWLANTGYEETHPWRISIRAAIARATA